MDSGQQVFVTGADGEQMVLSGPEAAALLAQAGINLGDQEQVMIGGEQGDQGGEGAEPLSLLPDVKLDHLLPPSKPQLPGIVSWSPPQQNWNPWIGEDQ